MLKPTLHLVWMPAVGFPGEVVQADVCVIRHGHTHLPGACPMEFVVPRHALDGKRARPNSLLLKHAVLWGERRLNVTRLAFA